MSTLKAISSTHAAEVMRKGAVLIDIREADEHAREHIPAACSVSGLPAISRGTSTHSPASFRASSSPWASMSPSAR